MYKYILPLILLFSITSCTLPEDGAIQNKKSNTLSETITIQDIGSINNGQTEGTGSFGFYADYPIFSGTSVTSVIEKWLNEEYKRIEDISTETREYMLELRPEYQASFEIFTGSSITTIAYRTYEFVGGAHGIDHFRTYSFDKNGRGVAFRDLFNDYDKNIETIKSELIKTGKQSPHPLDDESISEGIDEYLKNPAFYMTGDTLIILFDKYLVAPGSDGPQELVFHAKHLLKKEILGSFDYAPASSSGSNLPVENKKASLRIVDEVSAAENPKYIALTFDDGPSKANTPRLLDILKKTGAKATFYVLGKNASYFPDIVKRTYDEGHEIGSHSWDHPQLTRLSESQLYAQKTKTDAIIKKITGKIPATFRPPYGSINNTVRNVFGRPAILWSVDTLDWKYRNVAHNISVATTQTRDGSIILFHDIHGSSVDSIGEVVSALRAKGYTFVTVSELLAMGNKGKAVTSAVTCTTQWSCK